MATLRSVVAGAALLLAGPFVFLAPAAVLGDRAAPLEIAEWVKGKPVDLAVARGKQIVVVEFWATWCPPCLTSIPHLTQLQKQFKDKNVVIVGVTGEETGVVRPFVQRMGEKMDYVVGIDREGRTAKAYMEAYGQEGIPTAFIIDKTGHVVWVGHPLVDLERTLEAVVNGTFDPNTAKRRAEGMQLLQQFAAEAQAEQPDETQLERLAARIEQLDKEAGGIVPQQRLTAPQLLGQARAGRLLRRYETAVFEGADTKRLAALEAEIRPQLPADVHFDGIKAQMLGGRLMNDYLKIAGAGDIAGADKMQPRLLEELKNQPELLNNLAWTLATDERIPGRNLKFALQIARLAVDATREQNADILDTYARVLFENGQVADAIRYQEQAVKLADDNMKASLQEALDKYRARAERQP